MKKTLPGRARSRALRYARGVKKIILEILTLLWKAFKVVLWKWLRPMIGRIAFFAMLAVGLVVLVVVLASRM